MDQSEGKGSVSGWMLSGELQRIVDGDGKWRRSRGGGDRVGRDEVCRGPCGRQMGGGSGRQWHQGRGRW